MTRGRRQGPDLSSMVWLPRRPNSVRVRRSRFGFGFPVCCCSVGLVVVRFFVSLFIYCGGSLLVFAHQMYAFCEMQCIFFLHALQLMMHAIFVCCICGRILLYALMWIQRVLFALLPAAAFLPCAMCLTPSALLG